jgi:hypothetical protein
LKPVHFALHRYLRGLSALVVLGFLLLKCGESATPGSMGAKYDLSDKDALAWERYYVREADSIATLVWGQIGRGQFDAALLSITRFADPALKKDYEQRIEGLWSHLIGTSAENFTVEPQIGLGHGRPVGFRTWGELLSGGFQHGVLSQDSVSVYFVFKGYWQTDSLPVYAAIGCGDFGDEQVQWRPFSHITFSVDRSEEAVQEKGHAVISRSIEEFLHRLRTETKPVL